VAKAGYDGIIYGTAEAVPFLKDWVLKRTLKAAEGNFLVAFRGLRGGLRYHNRRGDGIVPKGARTEFSRRFLSRPGTFLLVYSPSVYGWYPSVRHLVNSVNWSFVQYGPPGGIVGG
jgi:hypothetical protein